MPQHGIRAMSNLDLGVAYHRAFALDARATLAAIEREAHRRFKESLEASAKVA